MRRRKSGILLHISSLPSPCGIGSLGESARQFVDFLEGAGQSCWQILPVGPTGYGDSPYQSFSSFAGNPYFIDLDQLAREGYLNRSEYESIFWEDTPDRVNYGILYQQREPVLRRAAERFLSDPLEGFTPFCDANAGWLKDYALFMALKKAHGGLPWSRWSLPLRRRERRAMQEAGERYAQEIKIHQAIQFFFFSQWHRLHGYAGRKGIELIGDLPFYTAYDSADVWAHPDLFQLDENLHPAKIAGCPPDSFSETGQLWGNPLYRWEAHGRDGYGWWIRRIGHLCGLCDILRIDHFRGFDAYYAIPADTRDARRGSWEPGPGMKLFQAMEEAIGARQIIAEDLGFMTDSVKTLLWETGFPGMKVLELAFDRRDPDSSSHLPHNHTSRCAAYTGTHDNDTIRGWFTSADPADRAFAKDYLHLGDDETWYWDVMKSLWAGTAELTIVQAQDLLGLGGESRMNTPSTTGINWSWRAVPGSFDDKLARKLRHEMILYERIGTCNDRETGLQ